MKSVDNAKVYTITGNTTTMKKQMKTEGERERDEQTERNILHTLIKVSFWLLYSFISPS
jgi:hypothetical protein